MLWPSLWNVTVPEADASESVAVNVTFVPCGAEFAGSAPSVMVTMLLGSVDGDGDVLSLGVGLGDGELVVHDVDGKAVCKNHSA